MPKMKFHRQFIIGKEKKEIGPGVIEIEEKSVRRWLDRGCELVKEEVSVEEIAEVLDKAEPELDNSIEEQEIKEDNVVEEIEEKPKKRGRKPKKDK